MKLPFSLQTKQNINRRAFLVKAGIASGITMLPLASPGISKALAISGRRSLVRGINLGVITYSFRSMPGSAEDLLGYLTDLGLSTVELMGSPAEEYAGAPRAPARMWGDLSDSEKQDLAKYQEDIKKWRTSVSMDAFKKLRKMYNSNGINIEIIKLPLDRMSPGEIEYAFKVAHAVGARGITLERSDETVEKLSPIADQYKTLIGYHNHAKVNFNSWDIAIAKSKYNALNLDVGHYVAGTNESPVPLIEKYHDRILNLHLKDRKMNEGDNMPWGQGDTPLKEILQLMRDNKYTFMGAIELEYPIPEGSDAVKEVRKCIEFCQNAVES
jgi:sugar phosphate isomerase/epimerase